LLAGLVAITAPCAFVDPWAAVVIGLISGVWVCIAAALLDKVHIDDPVGAVPVHFGNGIWGVLSVGLFANGSAVSAGWNGIAGPVTGLFYGGGFGQLLSQGAEVVALVSFVGLTTLVFFKILDALKLLRVSREVELQGLDIPEMGGVGYPQDWEPAADAIIYGREPKGVVVIAPSATD
jgi:Amt family ammonium transporter